LAEELELAMVDAVTSDIESFLPLGKLEAICRTEIIRRELLHTFGEDSPLLDLYTDYICGNQDGSTHDENASHRIFATLVLIGQLHKINDFVEAGIKDKHLPFGRPSRNPRKPFVSVQRPTLNKTIPEPIPCFNNWNLDEIWDFYMHQWRFLSPYFDRAPDGSVGLYELDEHSIMPWVRIKETKRGAFDPFNHFSTLAKVTQVEIHPDHHAFVRVLYTSFRGRVS
jgi:hypothetical protein